jgi:outer membrane receptor for ferrienterochelin and colicins
MKIILSLLLSIFFLSTNAQTIKGKLFGEDGGNREILPGGTIRWVESSKAVVVNENGVFELSATGITDLRIIASYAGYVTDTIATEGKIYLSIVLQKDLKQLGNVTVKGTPSFITNAVAKMEVINQRELSKAACCDLAGCFGTQASVQAHTTNIVTNAQELRILGLS